MIQLTCTHCRATLEMDDAFAGGVCRCQHCGTIQTVPSNLKPVAAPVASHASNTPRSLYQGRANGQVTSGLDQLADVVASSGLSRSGLQHQQGQLESSNTVSYRTPAAAKPAGNRVMLLMIAGAVILLLLGVIAWLAMRSAPAPTSAGASGSTASTSSGTARTSAGTSGGPAENNTNTSGGPTPATVSISGPSFCGVPLTAPKIVYVLDCGISSRSVFDPLKLSLSKSLRSLGSSKEFQVIFWKRGTEASVQENAYPHDKLAKADAKNIDACEKQIEDMVASGSTQVDEAIREAAARHPSAIILATAKGIQLDEGMIAAVENALKGQHIPVYTFALGNGNGSAILRTIAEKTGGSYHEISDAMLSQ